MTNKTTELRENLTTLFKHAFNAHKFTNDMDGQIKFEVDAAIRLIEKTVLDVIGQNSQQGDKVEGSAIPMGFDQATYWNTLRASQYEHLDRLLGK